MLFISPTVADYTLSPSSELLLKRKALAAKVDSFYCVIQVGTLPLKAPGESFSNAVRCFLVGFFVEVWTTLWWLAFHFLVSDPILPIQCNSFSVPGSPDKYQVHMST